MGDWVSMGSKQSPFDSAEEAWRGGVCVEWPGCRFVTSRRDCLPNFVQQQRRRSATTLKWERCPTSWPNPLIELWSEGVRQQMSCSFGILVFTQPESRSSYVRPYLRNTSRGPYTISAELDIPKLVKPELQRKLVSI